MLSAQDPSQFEEALPDSLIEEDKKAMETMMIWKLTEELNLQVEQADKFFPRFREHRKVIDEIKQAADFALKSPYPDEAELYTNVYA